MGLGEKDEAWCGGDVEAPDCETDFWGRDLKRGNSLREGSFEGL